MIRAVIDTNVFISGVAFKSGNPQKLVDLWLKQKFILISSLPLLSELAEVLLREKIRKATGIKNEEINHLLQQVTKIGVIVEDLPQTRIIKDDPDDTIFLVTAFGGNANYIVSGDHHLLDIGEYKGIQIVTPAVFLQILEKK